MNNEARIATETLVFTSGFPAAEARGLAYDAIREKAEYAYGLAYSLSGGSDSTDAHGAALTNLSFTR